MIARKEMVYFVSRSYPFYVISSFRNTGRIDWQDDAQSFGLDNYPYLKVAVLQRRKKDDGQNAYEIGRAFEIAKEPEFAKNAFNRAIQLKPDWKDPYRELGTVLFELQQYDAAEDALKKALAREREPGDPETKEKYAQVAFLLGKPDIERRMSELGPTRT
jgi:tetratricopeptide (TPR) repeat protein